MTRLTFAFVLLSMGLAGVAKTEAQAPGSGVANSGMEQGEAVVAVRSDVRLSIKGLRATLNDRLAAMTTQIAAQMPAIRGCYSKLVATRPATVGGLRATIVMEPGSAAPVVDIAEVDGSDAELTECVGKVLKRLDLRDVERPAAAEIALTFDNSRAAGQAQLEARQAAFEPNVERQADGSHLGRWRTDGGEIVFAVTTSGEDGQLVAREVVLAIRSGFSAFLDCRRRAGRQGMNPSGTLDLELRIGRDGKIAGRTVRSTTQDQKRTPGCVEKAIERASTAHLPRPGNATVMVEFSE